MLTIDSTNITEPVEELPRTDLQKKMIEAPYDIVFASNDALSKFLTKNATALTTYPQVLTEPGYQRMLSPIKSITIEVKEYADTWERNLKIITQHGDLKIRIFCVIKRHLLTAYLTDQFTKAKAKLNNSIVRDGDLFKECFNDYANMARDRLLEAGMVFGFGMNDLNEKAIRGAICVETKDPPMEKADPTRMELDLHVYPSKGPEVRVINDQEQFDALLTFLRWYFRVDHAVKNTMGINVLNNQKEGSLNYDSVKKGLENDRNQILKDLVTIGKTGFDFSAKHYASLDDIKADEKQHSKIAGMSRKCILKLTEISAKLGVTPYVKTAERPRVSVTSLEKGENPYKAPKASTPGALHFKTHKLEVHAKLGKLPKEDLAWVLYGKLQTGVSVDDIIIDIEDRCTAYTGKNGNAFVEKQIWQGNQDLIRQSVPDGAPIDIINTMLAKYHAAVESNIEILEGLKVH